MCLVSHSCVIKTGRVMTISKFDLLFRVIDDVTSTSRHQFFVVKSSGQTSCLTSRHTHTPGENIITSLTRDMIMATYSEQCAICWRPNQADTDLANNLPSRLLPRNIGISRKVSNKRKKDDFDDFDIPFSYQLHSIYIYKPQYRASHARSLQTQNFCLKGNWRLCIYQWPPTVYKYFTNWWKQSVIDSFFWYLQRTILCHRVCYF